MTEALTTVTADADLEQRASTGMRAIGKRIAERPELSRALVAADILKEGYVVASEEQAAEMADLMVLVIDGERFLSDQVKQALRIPKMMEAAVKDVVEPTKARLAKAHQAGNNARVAWQNTLRRRAAEAEEKARQEAAEAARIAAEEAALTGDDIPPMAEVAPVEVPRTVAGGTARMGTQVRVEPVEVVDPLLALEHGLMTLHAAAARAVFAADSLAGTVKKPAPGESIVYKGVRFEARETAVNRRA